MANTAKKPAATKAAPKKTAPKKTAEQMSLPKAPDPVPPETDFVDYMIPLDPDREPTDQFFEYNINGVTYRHRRGVMLHHPRKHAEAILAKLDKISKARESMSAFLNMTKKLN
jgi:hypothetical protein